VVGRTEVACCRGHTKPLTLSVSTCVSSAPTLSRHRSRLRCGVYLIRWVGEIGRARQRSLRRKLQRIRLKAAAAAAVFRVLEVSRARRSIELPFRISRNLRLLRDLAGRDHRPLGSAARGAKAGTRPEARKPRSPRQYVPTDLIGPTFLCDCMIVTMARPILHTYRS
jgi:hypothetical protein